MRIGMLSMVGASRWVETSDSAVALPFPLFLGGSGGLSFSMGASGVAVFGGGAVDFCGGVARFADARGGAGKVPLLEHFWSLHVCPVCLQRRQGKAQSHFPPTLWVLALHKKSWEPVLCHGRDVHPTWVMSTSV
jgi:hypothetical protein